MFSKKVIVGAIALGTLALIAVATGGNPGPSEATILPAAAPLAGKAEASRTASKATATVVEPAALAPKPIVTTEAASPEKPTGSAPTKPKLAASTSPAPAPGGIHGDRDCGDFGSQAQAQRFFVANGGPGSDPHKLDRDHDGIVCESI